MCDLRVVIVHNEPVMSEIVGESLSYMDESAIVGVDEIGASIAQHRRRHPHLVGMAPHIGVPWCDDRGPGLSGQCVPNHCRAPDPIDVALDLYVFQALVLAVDALEVVAADEYAAFKVPEDPGDDGP